MPPPPPKRGQSWTKQPKHGPQQPGTVSGGPPPDSNMRGGQLDAHGAPWAPKEPRYTPPTACSAPFWADLGANASTRCRSQTIAVSQAGQPEWRFRGHFCPMQAPTHVWLFPPLRNRGGGGGGSPPATSPLGPNVATNKWLYLRLHGLNSNSEGTFGSFHPLGPPKRAPRTLCRSALREGGGGGVDGKAAAAAYRT